MKILPLVGYQAYLAFNAFHHLILGLKQLPMYDGLDYDAFLTEISNRAEEEREKAIRHAVNFVALGEDEVLSLICFAVDVNNVPYGPSNIKNLKPAQLVDVMVNVCMEIARIQVNLINEDEKKKIRKRPVDLRQTLIENPTLPLADLINITMLKAVSRV